MQTLDSSVLYIITLQMQLLFFTYCVASVFIIGKSKKRVLQLFISFFFF